MAKTVPAQLEEFGVELHKLLIELPDHAAVTDTLDYVLGSLYSLAVAHETGFRDRLQQHVAVYRPHLANYALKVATPQSLDSLWRAGFYFNSAIQRLAAVFDRLPRVLGAKTKKKVRGKMQATSAKERMAEVSATAYTEWERVYDEVNAFKHSPEGRAAGRTVTMSDAIAAFAQMLALIADNRAVLMKRYGP